MKLKTSSVNQSIIIFLWLVCDYSKTSILVILSLVASQISSVVEFCLADVAISSVDWVEHGACAALLLSIINLHVTTNRNVVFVLIRALVVRSVLRVCIILIFIIVLVNLSHKCDLEFLNLSELVVLKRRCPCFGQQSYQFASLVRAYGSKQAFSWPDQVSLAIRHSFLELDFVLNTISCSICKSEYVD